MSERHGAVDPAAAKAQWDRLMAERWFALERAAEGPLQARSLFREPRKPKMPSRVGRG
jgi:hypothetical protein